MPEPIIKATASPVIATTTPANGAGSSDEFGATQMEELVTKAYEEARPNPFKGKPAQAEAAKPAEEAKPATERTETTQATEGEQKPSEIKPPAKAAQWKEVNEERARLKAENEAFKAQQEKYKTWEDERKEYDTIKKERAELLARLETAALERSPRFENYFKAKTETALALAKRAVGDDHAEHVAKLLQLPDSDFRNQALNEIRSGLDGIRAGRLDAALIRMDEISLEKETALAKSKENWQATLEAERTEKENHKRQFERTFQDTLEKWSDPEKGLALFQKKDGDEAHNAEVQQRIETARNILNLNLGADQLAKAALWSAAAPGLLKTQMALAQENKALKAELEALKAGGPELKTGEEEKPVDDEKQYENMSYGEIIAKKAQMAGGWQK